MPSGAQIYFSDASEIEIDEPTDSTFPLITCSRVICFPNLSSKQTFLFTVTLPKTIHSKLLHYKDPVYILSL